VLVLANGAMVKNCTAQSDTLHYTKEHSVYRTYRRLDLIPVAPIVDEDLFEAAQEKLEQNGCRSENKVQLTCWG